MSFRHCLEQIIFKGPCIKRIVNGFEQDTVKITLNQYEVFSETWWIKSLDWCWLGCLGQIFLKAIKNCLPIKIYKHLPSNTNSSQWNYDLLFVLIFIFGVLKNMHLTKYAELHLLLFQAILFFFFVFCRSVTTMNVFVICYRVS